MHPHWSKSGFGRSERYTRPDGVHVRLTGDGRWIAIQPPAQQGFAENLPTKASAEEATSAADNVWPFAG